MKIHYSIFVGTTLIALLGGAIFGAQLTHLKYKPSSPYLIVYDAYTDKDLQRCQQDPYCNDILTFDELSIQGQNYNH